MAADKSETVATLTNKPNGRNESNGSAVKPVQPE